MKLKLLLLGLLAIVIFSSKAQSQWEEPTSLTLSEAYTLESNPSSEYVIFLDMSRAFDPICCEVDASFKGLSNFDTKA